MAQIRTEHLFKMTIEVEFPVRSLGKTPYGGRRIANIPGGNFSGSRLNGAVLGGGDWLIDRVDEVAELDVRLTLQTDDGALIYMTYGGLRHGPPDVIERILRNEPVNPTDYYFRTTPMFETSADKYQWINKIVGVGTGEIRGRERVFDVFEVL